MDIAQRQTQKSLTTLKLLNFLVLGIFIIALLGFWEVLKPVNPLHIQQVTVTSSSVSARGVLLYDFVYCKDSKIFPIVYRQLVAADNNIPAVTFPSVQGITVSGCHTAHLTLPLNGQPTPGTYKLKGHLVYQVNGFKTVTYDYLTNPFTVTK